MRTAYSQSKTIQVQGGHVDLCGLVGGSLTASRAGSVGADRATKARATCANAASTFNPVLADVSINATWYSRANRCPSSRRTARSRPLSDLLPAQRKCFYGLHFACTFEVL